MPDDDLETRVAELEDALRELRREVRRPPRGPLGLPRPPTPGELARAADDHAIPAAIASLEATIHALELLRLALPAGDATRRRGGLPRSERSRRESVSAAALNRLDGALDDLTEALEGTPSDPEARRLLSETRRLREEVRGRVGDAVAEADSEVASRGGKPKTDAGSDGESAEDTPGDDPPQVDVESELQSIKDEENQTGSKR